MHAGFGGRHENEMGKTTMAFTWSGTEGERGTSVGPWAGSAQAEEKGNSAKQVG